MSEHPPLTDFERRALKAITLHVAKYHDSISASEFARAMWPDSPGWNRISKSGQSGSTQGKNMPFMAGSHLWRMYRKGLLTPRFHQYQTCWLVSSEGRRRLREIEST